VANSQLFLLNLNQDLVVKVLLVIYIHFLYVWLAHVINMVKTIEELQENTEILEQHKAHRISVATQKHY